MTEAATVLLIEAIVVFLGKILLGILVGGVVYIIGALLFIRHLDKAAEKRRMNRESS